LRDDVVACLGLCRPGLKSAAKSSDLGLLCGERRAELLEHGFVGGEPGVKLAVRLGSGNGLILRLGRRRGLGYRRRLGGRRRSLELGLRLGRRFGRRLRRRGSGLWLDRWGRRRGELRRRLRWRRLGCRIR
jgi:hypothetical protein